MNFFGVWVFVSRLRGRTQTHGGDNCASEDSAPVDEYQAVRAAAKRAAKDEDSQVSENGGSGASAGISHSREEGDE